MKITETIAVSSSNNEDSVTATLSSDDMAKLWYMFESPYKNSIASLIREYTSNGWDANVEAGVNEPVMVGLSPWTEEGAYFYVLDQGIGMSEKFIRNNFSRYLYSPKTQNNNAIGAWGIGSKSGLSYSPMVEFESTQNGITTSFILRKSDDSPVFDILSVENEGKPEGTLVKIPVQSESDISKFKKEVYRQLRFFPNVYFKETLSMYNSIVMHDAGSFKIVNLDDPNSNHLNRMEISLLVGPVAYPIDMNQLTSVNVPNIGLLQVDSKLDIGLKLNIGDVDVTPSREDVKYNEKTYLAIEKALTLFQKDIDRVINENIKQVSFKELYSSLMVADYKLAPHFDTSKLSIKILNNLSKFYRGAYLLPIEDYLFKFHDKDKIDDFHSRLIEAFTMFCGVSWLKFYRNTLEHYKTPLFASSKVLRNFEKSDIADKLEMPYKFTSSYSNLIYGLSNYHVTAKDLAKLSNLKSCHIYNMNGHPGMSNHKIHIVISEAGHKHSTKACAGIYYWDKYKSLVTVLEMLKAIFTPTFLGTITPQISELNGKKEFSWSYASINKLKESVKGALEELCDYSSDEVDEFIDDYKARNKKAPKERASRADGKVYLRQFVCNVHGTDFKMENTVAEIEDLYLEDRLPIITTSREELEMIKSFNYSLKNTSGLRGDGYTITVLGKEVLLVEPTKISKSVLEKLDKVYTFKEFVAKEVSFMDRFIIDLNFQFADSPKNAYGYKNRRLLDSTQNLLEYFMASDYNKSKFMHAASFNNVSDISDKEYSGKVVALLAIREATISEKEARLFAKLKRDLHLFFNLYQKDNKHSTLNDINAANHVLLQFAVTYRRLPFFLNVSHKLNFYSKYPNFKCNGKK
jgi:hypothetical protein